MVNDALELDTVFGALADATRRGMLEQLARSAATVGELGRPYPITKGAVSKHVKVLERAGLLHRSVEGRNHRCDIRTEPLDHAQLWLERVETFWEARLDDLALYLNGLQADARDNRGR